MQKKYFVLGPGLVTKADQKSLVPTRQAQQTKEGPLSFVLFEPSLTSVSTISRGNPSLVSLSTALCQRTQRHLTLQLNNICCVMYASLRTDYEIMDINKCSSLLFPHLLAFSCKSLSPPCYLFFFGYILLSLPRIPTSTSPLSVFLSPFFIFTLFSSIPPAPPAPVLSFFLPLERNMRVLANFLPSSSFYRAFTKSRDPLITCSPLAFTLSHPSLPHPLSRSVTRAYPTPSPTGHWASYTPPRPTQPPASHPHPSQPPVSPPPSLPPPSSYSEACPTGPGPLSCWLPTPFPLFRLIPSPLLLPH